MVVVVVVIWLWSRSLLWLWREDGEEGAESTVRTTPLISPPWTAVVSAPHESRAPDTIEELLEAEFFTLSSVYESLNGENWKLSVVVGAVADGVLLGLLVWEWCERGWIWEGEAKRVDGRKAAGE